MVTDFLLTPTVTAKKDTNESDGLFFFVYQIASNKEIYICKGFFMKARVVSL